MEFADRSDCSLSAGTAFSAPVVVGCDGLPGGAICMYAVTVSTPETQGLNPFTGQPQTIRPSPGERLNFTLGVVGAWPTGGTFRFEATATAGTQRHAAAMSIALPTRPTGLGLSCRPQALTIALGGDGQAACTLTSVGGYEGTFHLSCPPSGGVTCADTSDIHVTPGSSITVPVVFSAPAGIRASQYTLFVLPTPMQRGVYQDKVVYVTAQGQ